MIDFPVGSLWRRAEIHQGAITLGIRGGDPLDAEEAREKKTTELRIITDKYVKAVNERDKK